jgi:hypothetical protein
MKILDMLFKGNTQNDVLDMQPIEKTTFIDENPPVQDNSNQSERARIDFLIEFDYESEGIKDGFNLPNQNVMEYKTERYKAELLKEYDSLIDKKNEKISKLKSLKSSVDNIDTLFAAEIILDITNLESQNQTLISEKNKIEDGTGSFIIIINNYKIGYIKGVQKFKDTQIFNK